MNYLEEMKQLTNYEPKYDYWNLFDKMEKKWKAELKQMLKTEFEVLKSKDLKDEVVYQRLTEFVMLLNWRAWFHSDNLDTDLSELYVSYRDRLHSWCCSHLKGEWASYYFRTTD